MWIFGFSPGVCPTDPSNLVFSLGCLVSNGRRALLRGIRLGGSATKAFDHDRVVEAQQDAVDLLEESRKTIIIRSSRY